MPHPIICNQLKTSKRRTLAGIGVVVEAVNVDAMMPTEITGSLASQGGPDDSSGSDVDLSIEVQKMGLDSRT